MNSERRPTAPRPITWTVWPMGEVSPSIAFVAICVIGSSASTWWVTGKWVLALGVAAAVAAAAWRAFIPHTYELNSLGLSIEVGGWRWRVAWRNIAAYELGKSGVYLAPRGSRWPWLRGHYLPWKDRRAEVVSLLEYYVGPNRGGSEVRSPAEHATPPRESPAAPSSADQPPVT